MASNAKKAKRRKQKKLPRRTIGARPVRPAGAGRRWIPSRLPDEPVEDVAIFSAEVRRRDLDESLRPQAEAVVRGLDLCSYGFDEAALEAVESIPRQSPYAQWRLFLRGMIAHQAGDLEASHSNWSKLDPARRPYRIAAALRIAENAPVDGPVDESMRWAAQRLTELRGDDRPWQAARRLARSAMANDSRREITFTSDDLNELFRLRDEHAATAPRLVRLLERACLQRCMFQPHHQLFARLAARISGPLHDPRWNLLSWQYSLYFRGAEQLSESHFQRYVNQDLPQLKNVDGQLIAALTSCAWLDYAMLVGRAKVRMMGPFGSSAVDQEAFTMAVQRAITAYPANASAHRTMLDVLEATLEGSHHAGQRREIEARITAAREAWVAGVPAAVDQRLALIDHYLEADDVASAQRHVEQIRDQRLDDPVARALPWKVKLREAMRLSKYKRQLKFVAEAFREGEESWPQWYPRDWAPFLKAAMLHRSGNLAEGERILESLQGRPEYPPVVFDVLWFGAAQQFNLPTPLMRELRTEVEDAAKHADGLPEQHLIRLGEVYWYLESMGLLYRGHRNHLSKFGRGLVDWLYARGMPPSGDAVIRACLWAAGHRFWWGPDEYQDPPMVRKLKSGQPRWGAAISLTAIIELRHPQVWLREHQSDVEHLRKLVEQPHGDPLMQRHLQRLLARIDQQLRSSGARFGGFGPMATSADLDDDDHEDQDFDGLDAAQMTAEISEQIDQMNDLQVQAMISAAPPELGRLFDLFPPDQHRKLLRTLVSTFGDPDQLDSAMERLVRELAQDPDMARRFQDL